MVLKPKKIQPTDVDLLTMAAQNAVQQEGMNPLPITQLEACFHTFQRVAALITRRPS